MNCIPKESNTKADLLPKLVSTKKTGHCGSKTTRDFDDANIQVFFMDNSSELQEIQEIQVTSTS